jgi:hypothetical protein
MSTIVPGNFVSILRGIGYGLCTVKITRKIGMDFFFQKQKTLYLYDIYSQFLNISSFENKKFSR